MNIKSAKRMREISNKMNRVEINSWSRYISEEIEKALLSAGNYGGYCVKIPFVGMPKYIFNSMIEEDLKDLIEELVDNGYSVRLNEEDRHNELNEKVDFKIDISW